MINDCNVGMALVSIDCHEISIEPFVRETHSTVLKERIAIEETDGIVTSIDII